MADRPTATPARRPAAHPWLEHTGPLAFAHRGGTESAPENSLAAFAAAVSVGFRYLETDVHLTVDGVVVATHDERLERVADAGGAIAEMTWSEVRRARLGGTEPIPTFEELLEAFPHQRFNVDPKSDAVVDALVATLVRLDAVHRVCIGAFSDERLARVRTALGPDVCTSAGPRETARLVAASKVPGAARRAGAGRTGYQCLQVPVRHRGVELVTRRFVETAHARGAQVHVWTIDDPAEMHRLLDLGVDGLMTDRPSVLRSVLEARGEWRPPGAPPTP
jgi:glycerophosphoryl diester phosphodiesterase